MQVFRQQLCILKQRLLFVSYDVKCLTVHKRHNVQVIYMGNKEWLCYRKSILDEDSEKLMSSHPKYEHLRTVTIDCDGYMSCTCGHVHQYMAPCIHIMAILDNKKFVTPALFHLRWWKVYNYYFLTDHGRSLTPEIHRCLLEGLKLQNEKSFDDSGVYRGCDITGNGFLDSIFELSDHDSIEVKTGLALKKYLAEDGPIHYGSVVYRKYIDSSDCSGNDDESNFPDFGGEIEVEDSSSGLICSLGGVAGISGNESKSVQQSNIELNEALGCNDELPLYKGTNLWNMAESAVTAARTVDQQDKLMTLLRSFKDECIAENRISKSNGGSTFIGEDSSGPNVSKRKKTYV